MSYHTGVMVKEVLEVLEPKPNDVILDGTVGGATHAIKIAEKISPGGTLVALDKDHKAVEYARLALRDIACRLIIEKSDFVNMKEICKKEGVHGLDGILLDIGISSYQLDTPERGFSYQYEGPLDMRMDEEQKLDASEVINKFDVNEIAQILRQYGEERWAKRIATKIVEKRVEKEITTTNELVEIIKGAIPVKARQTGPHPAKRTFQALRIYVNRELEKLEQALDKGIELLNSGGRFVVISFHSLEDRLIKNKFKEFESSCECPPKVPECVCKKESMGRILTRKPIRPSNAELEYNHRARSAKLRAFLKKGSKSKGG